MHMHHRHSFFLLLSSLIFLAISCKKNGTGGKAELHLIVFHGSNPIIGTTTLYVKFDAKTQPADPTTDYDLKVHGEMDDNHVHIMNLLPGNYYLYAIAYDSLAMTPVKGGTAVTLKWSERKKEKEIELQTSN